MSYEMFVVAFDEKNKAHEVLRELQQLDEEKVIELADAAAIVKDEDGSLSLEGEDASEPLEDATAGARRGAYDGATSGGVGVLVGIVLGAIDGIFHPRATDVEFDDRFLAEVGENLKPGGSAIVALVEFEQIDRAMQELHRFEGGRILRHRLSQEAYTKLSAALQ